MISKRDLRRIAALPGVQTVVHAKAIAIQKTAQSLAAGHGTLALNIHVERPNTKAKDLDYDVILDRPNALSIEAGHIDKVRGSGFVPGLHVLRDAAQIT